MKRFPSDGRNFNIIHLPITRFNLIATDSVIEKCFKPRLHAHKARVQALKTAAPTIQCTAEENAPLNDLIVIKTVRTFFTNTLTHTQLVHEEGEPIRFDSEKW